MFDYAINDCGYDGNWFVTLFLQSGYAEQFERGNPAFVGGMSGIELAQKVIEKSYHKYEHPVSHFREGRTPEYWCGWALAQYQWEKARRFQDIFNRISFHEIVEMYPIYHEMDISHFIEDFDQKYRSIVMPTKLKMIREAKGISQSQLAKKSGVSLRSIQMYEQKINDIDKAQAQTVYKLSRILGCNIEDILEKPED